MTFPTAQLECCPSTNTVRRDLARGHQKVGVAISGVGAWARLMNRTVDCASILVGQLRRKRANQEDTLAWCQFWGHEYEPLPCSAGVVASAGMLHGIPEYGAILGPSHVWTPGKIRRENHLFVGDVPAMREIVDLAGSLVFYALA